MGFEKRQPDYKGNGVAVWEDVASNGTPMLRINLLDGSIKTLAFKNDPKPTEPQN